MVGWLADVQHWRRPTIGNAQLHFFNFFFLFFSFLAGLMGKRACGREHILCERAVALSMICTRQTKPNCTHCLRFCLDARLSGRAAKVRRKCHCLRANVPYVFFSETSFSPSAHCHRRHSCCLHHRRPHHYGRRRILVNAPLSMCLLFLLLFMHGGPGASKSATHPSEHGGLYQRAAN